jgi:hypothetical protein
MKARYEVAIIATLGILLFVPWLAASIILGRDATEVFAKRSGK